MFISVLWAYVAFSVNSVAASLFHARAVRLFRVGARSWRYFSHTLDLWHQAQRARQTSGSAHDSLCNKARSNCSPNAAHATSAYSTATRRCASRPACKAIPHNVRSKSHHHTPVDMKKKNRRPDENFRPFRSYSLDILRSTGTHTLGWMALCVSHISRSCFFFFFLKRR